MLGFPSATPSASFRKSASSSINNIADSITLTSHSVLSNLPALELASSQCPIDEVVIADMDLGLGLGLVPLAELDTVDPAAEQPASLEDFIGESSALSPSSSIGRTGFAGVLEAHTCPPQHTVQESNGDGHPLSVGSINSDAEESSALLESAASLSALFAVEQPSPCAGPVKEETRTGA